MVILDERGNLLALAGHARSVDANDAVAPRAKPHAVGAGQDRVDRRLDDGPGHLPIRNERGATLGADPEARRALRERVDARIREAVERGEHGARRAFDEDETAARRDGETTAREREACTRVVERCQHPRRLGDLGVGHRCRQGEGEHDEGEPHRTGTSITFSFSARSTATTRSFVVWSHAPVGLHCPTNSPRRTCVSERTYPSGVRTSTRFASVSTLAKRSRRSAIVPRPGACASIFASLRRCFARIS